MASVFVAYATGNAYQAEIITNACAAATTPKRAVVPWSINDTSGYAIAKSVETWIEEADAFIADVSRVNDNVTFEIGYAIGFRKPVRLIRSTQTDWNAIKAIGLLDTLGHDAYGIRLDLSAVLRKPDIDNHWPNIKANKDQPVFIL